MRGEGKVVCVTGASGYIASWLVKQLLERGYTVKATVHDDSKIKHLHALDGAKERLHFFEANLPEEGSFDSAVKGCEGVFHTASPVIILTNNPQAEVIDPAVKGTLNVLKSCAKVQSIKRVVITSSMASVIHNENPRGPDVVVNETWFSSTDFCKKMKTLAEEGAWEFAKENGIDLVTLHPGVVIGPFLQPMLNFSVELILSLINGDKTFPSRYALVDVRDVAYAHIQALDIRTAGGRYLLIARITQPCEVLDLLHKHYPSLHLNEKFRDAKYEPTFQVSQEKAKSLGINFKPWEVSLRDTVECFKEKGFLIV